MKVPRSKPIPGLERWGKPSSLHHKSGVVLSEAHLCPDRRQLARDEIGALIEHHHQTDESLTAPFQLLYPFRVGVNAWCHVMLRG